MWLLTGKEELQMWRQSLTHLAQLPSPLSRLSTQKEAQEMTLEATEACFLVASALTTIFYF